MVWLVPTLVLPRIQEYNPVSIDSGSVNTKSLPTWLAEAGRLVRPGLKRTQRRSITLLTLEVQLS